MRGICRDHPEFPKPTTIYRWLSDYPEFREQYARAREDQGDACADRAMEILEELDPSTKTSPGTGESGACVAHANNKAKHLEWMAGRLAPSVNRLELSGPGGGDIPLSARVSLEDKLDALAAKLDVEAGDGGA